MSMRKRAAPSDLTRSRTSLKLDLLNAANVDDGFTHGAFRFFARVMQQVDMATWTATISDDRISAELPGRMHRNTANDHRKAIRDAGYWEYDSGSGRHPTRYFIAERIPEALKVQLAEKKRAFELAKEAERADRDVVRRPRKASSRRGAQTSDTVVPTPPVHLLSPYQESRRQQDETPNAHARESLTCSCGKKAVRKRRQRPSQEHPDGTPWQFQCAECAEDDDQFPSPSDEIRELAVKQIGWERPTSCNSGDDYRRARDGF